MGLKRNLKKRVSGFFVKRRAMKFLEEFRGRKKPVRVQVASGRHYLEGWINIEISSRLKKDLWLDVRKGLPFPDGSVDFLFNEHFIEHLSYEEGLEFLCEVHRVLKPGGVVRIAFPDLDRVIDSYRDDTWRQMEWVRLVNAQWYPSGCFMLNEFIREKGLHKYMYNQSELRRRLCEAGFADSKIADCHVNRSRHTDLVNIERRADSAVIEATK